MKVELSKVIVSLVLLMLLMAVPSFSAEVATTKAGPDVIIEKISGDVEVMKSGSAEWVKAQDKMELGRGDRIKTLLPKGEATLKLSDGTTLTILEEADLEITELKGSKEGVDKTILSLQYGSLRANFPKVKPEEKPSLEIKTPLAVCQAKGTIAYVSVTHDLVTVHVIEGALLVINKLTNQEHLVLAPDTITIKASPDVLGYVAPEGAGGDVIIFTPDSENPASKT